MHFEQLHKRYTNASRSTPDMLLYLLNALIRVCYRIEVNKFLTIVNSLFLQWSVIATHLGLKGAQKLVVAKNDILRALQAGRA